MSYLHGGEYQPLSGYLGRGSSCACPACRAGGLSEGYVREEPGGIGRTGGLGFGLGETAPTAGVTTHVFKIVVKSYIAPIGLGHGSLPLRCAVLSPGAPVKLAALAAVTDASYSENPLTDAKDKRYRLYSARTFTVTCKDGPIVNVAPSAMDTDAGKECIPRTTACLQPPDLTTSAVTATPTGPNSFEFSWTAQGRPHALAEPAFQGVCLRTSVFIWHRIRGRIECGPSTAKVETRLSGSAFPSHRLFVDGVIKSTIPQGGFANLWVSRSLTSPTIVS